MSIRLRLAFTYSLVLCLLAGLAIGAIYLALAHAVDTAPPPIVTNFIQPGPGGGATVTPVQLEGVQRAANRETLDKLRSYSVSALLIFFVASFGVSWLIAGYLLRPIKRITQVARDISATDLSRRIDLHGPDDELHQLADTFDQMLGRLDAAFVSQREFIQDASHELRNPLAVIRTNLEVTLSDPDASPEAPARRRAPRLRPPRDPGDRAPPGRCVLPGARGGRRVPSPGRGPGAAPRVVGRTGPAGRR
jgi:signal transduction histidine kinase